MHPQRFSTCPEKFKNICFKFRNDDTGGRVSEFPCITHKKERTTGILKPKPTGNINKEKEVENITVYKPKYEKELINYVN